MLTKDELAELLRVHKHKVTPQRLAIYAALTSQKWHPNAENIYQKLHPVYPSMSFATVYKAVEILSEINAIRVLSTEEGNFRFDGNTDNHQHIQCVKCGEIEDVEVPHIASITSKVAKSSGYEIKKREFYFFGVCPKCREIN